MNQCVICGKETKKGFLCLEHYKQSKATRLEIDKNQGKEDLEKHYKQLKNQIFYINKIEYAENASLTLITLAQLTNDLFNDSSLLDRVYTDVQSLLERKREYLKKLSENNKKQTAERFNDEDFRKQWAAEYRCDDGHYVRSKGEKAIDDWLYSKNIIHAYEKTIFMESDPDAIVISDFFIKEIDAIIEFWGLEEDEKYLDRKEKKIKLYSDNNYKLINLDENAVKRLDDLLPRELNKNGWKLKK